MWVAVESNHAPLSYQESVLADELATLICAENYLRFFLFFVKHDTALLRLSIYLFYLLSDGSFFINSKIRLFLTVSARINTLEHIWLKLRIIHMITPLP